MLASTIQRELAEMVMRDLDDPRVPSIISITRVKVSPDLSVADVFFTALGTAGQESAALHALRQASGMMRGKLTRALSLKQAPFLKFHVDDNLKRELGVLGLIDQARREREEREQREQEQQQQQPTGEGGGDGPAVADEDERDKD